MSEPMNPAEAFAAIAEHYTDQLIVTGVGTALQEWQRVFGWEDESFQTHTMGLTSSVGAGLAMARPDREVWAFEGDGGLLVNFGSLVTLAEQRPPNLKYFLVSNRRHRTIEGPPIVGAELLDYVGLGRTLTFPQAVAFSDVTTLRKELAAVLGEKVFGMITLEVGSQRDGKPIAPFEAAEVKYRFGRYVERETGASVFGPLGY
jgi:hypothetical protein